MRPRAPWICALALTLFALAALGQEAENFNAHLQSTYVRQLKPSMRSPYEGMNSLTGAREASYSFTATAALGLRLGPSTEVYFNPEAALGVPLSNLTGLSEFSNGELAKTSGPHLTVYPARLFLRHVVNLGGERTRVESSANQLAGSYDARRLVLTAGALSALDLFDQGRYARDPRTQFMNWALMTHAAYDYPADSRGYTRGVAVEYFGDGWSARVARLAVPREPNGLPLDPHPGSRFGDQVEVSRDLEAGGRPGSIRVLAYRVRARMAAYERALQLTPPGAAPDLDAGRDAVRQKRGVGLAIDQEVADGIGMFGRIMRADGKTETYAFTESDGSASAGASVDGRRWHRSGDTVGVAVAASRLSGAHREFLERGGTTFFLGDNGLHYGPEQLVEVYYSWRLPHGVRLTLDAQRIFHPGFNRDRGPASFIATRLHWEN